MSEQTRHYEVHLKADVADELGVGSPIGTEHVDFYDSGLWVAGEGGRDFYPYDNVLTIHERPAPGGTTETEAEAAEQAEE